MHVYKYYFQRAPAFKFCHSWMGSVISKNIDGSTIVEHVPKILEIVNTIHDKLARGLVSASKRDPISKIFRDLRLLKLTDIYYIT